MAVWGFGIETEFLLVNKDDFSPACQEALRFAELKEIIDSIPAEDFGQEGFNIKPLHTKASPYLIEGYYLTDAEMNPLSLLPKGIELRTPKFPSIEEAIEAQKELFNRLRKGCLDKGFDLAILAHHPQEPDLQAPANYKRYDYWQWALVAATTYGPDINISVPEELARKIDRQALAGRINFYMPAVISLTFASPLGYGGLWTVKGKVGQSLRTFRRSIWAPLFYVHEKPQLRFEFKGYEMSRTLSDYNALFLISLALLLDESLDQVSSDAARIYDLGRLSQTGLESGSDCDTARRVLQAAENIAGIYGFSRLGLDEFWRRLDTKHVPAHDIIALYEKSGSICGVLSQLIGFDTADDTNEIEKVGAGDGKKL